MIRVVGIDVGARGALVSLSSAGDVDTRVMPESIHEAADILEAWAPHHVYLERAQSMPKQGVASAFNYGRHFGQLEATLIALKLPHTLVQPRAWTKVMHVGTKAGEPKARSLEAVRRLYPSVELVQPRCKKPHDGVVDALLLASFCMRTMFFPGAA